MSETRLTLSVAPRWVPTVLSRRLLVVSTLCVLALLLRPGPTSLAAFAVSAVLLAGVLVVPRPGAVPVQVELSTRRLVQGQVLAVGVRLTEPRGTGVVLTVRAYPHSGLVPVPPVDWLVDDELVLRWRAETWLRDAAGTLDLILTTPRGGWVAHRSLDLPEVIVHPRSAPARRVGAPPRALARLGAHGSRTYGAGTDFADIRDYVPGDLVRDVNWRAAARTGRLMVSRRYTDQAADVVLLLDHTAIEGSYDAVGLDRAVTDAAALAVRHLAVGDRASLVLFGGRLGWVPVGRGRAHRMRILDELVQRPREDVLVSPEVARIPTAAIPRRAVVVVFSGLLDERVVVACVTLANRGHRVVVVDTAGIEPPTWPPDVLAETRDRWRARRIGLRRDLAGSGVLVVDDVEHIAPRVRALARHRVVS